MTDNAVLDIDDIHSKLLAFKGRSTWWVFPRWEGRG